MKGMKKIGMTLLVGLLLFGMVLSAGCVDEEGETTSVETDENEQSEDTTETTTTEETSTSGMSLSDLLSKARDSSSVSYDMVMSGGPMGAMTTKVWSTEKMTKTESAFMGQTTIVIIDNEEMVMYSYDPAQNTVYKADIGESQAVSGTESFEDVFEKYNPTIVGTEIIDGKMCTVIEYETEGIAVSTKMWIWQEYGSPIKVESTQSIAGRSTTMVMEMKNIKFGSIPDSEFELPEGAEIREFEPGFTPDSEFELPEGMEIPNALQ